MIKLIYEATLNYVCIAAISACCLRYDVVGASSAYILSSEMWVRSWVLLNSLAREQNDGSFTNPFSRNFSELFLFKYHNDPINSAEQKPSLYLNQWWHSSLMIWCHGYKSEENMKMEQFLYEVLVADSKEIVNIFTVTNWIRHVQGSFQNKNTVLLRCGFLL